MFEKFAYPLTQFMKYILLFFPRGVSVFVQYDTCFALFRDKVEYTFSEADMSGLVFLKTLILA